MGSVARFPAVLRGPGVEAPCILEAWHEQSSAGRLFVRGRITEDPPELPDGAYLVAFERHTVRTNKVGGRWELVFLPAEVGNDLRQWSAEAAI